MRCLGLVPLVLLGAAVPAAGATLRVPSEYATINAALDASTAGDSVLVAPGVYDEYETRLIAGQFWISSVGFLRSGVVLRSEQGAASTTLRLDTASATPIVLDGFQSQGAVEVSGFTISGTAPSLGGVTSGGGRLVVRNCAFGPIGTGRTDEGGIGSIQADLEVYNCRFEDINGWNAIDQTSGTLLVEDSEFLNCRSGAILASYDTSRPHATGLTVRRCRFVGNVATNGAGGAVGVGSYASGVIEDCWFEENTSNGTGGAIIATGTSSVYTVRTCVFTRNSTHGAAAAIYSSGTSVVVEGNSFVDNETTRPQVFAGAVTLRGAGQRTVRRNVAVNSIGDPAFYIESTSGLTEGCNVFWNNGWGNAQGFTPSATDLEADPLFCDPAANDFHVGVGSPCLPGSGHPSCAELIGAWGEGCGTVSIEPTSWGQVKAAYRGGAEAVNPSAHPVDRR